MNKNQIFKLFSIVSFVFFVSQVWTRPTFEAYNTKANKHFALLHQIYNKYPIADRNKFIRSFSNREKRWEDIEALYKQSTGHERNKVLLLVRSHYLDLLEYVERACRHLKSYSNDILIDFTEKRKGKNLDIREREIYANSFGVAKREIHRAEKAFLGHQFNYSARLYDRAVVILANAYKKLDWVMPPTYENIQTIEPSPVPIRLPVPVAPQ